jgi:hypothetical protein
VQGVLQEQFGQSLLGKQTSELREALTERGEEQALVCPVGTGYLEIIQHQTQHNAAGVWAWVDGTEISGDGQFIIDLGGVFLRDADLKGQKDILADDGNGLLARD